MSSEIAVNTPLASPLEERGQPFIGDGDKLAPFITAEQAQTDADPAQTLRFVVPNLNCAGCMRKIERHFANVPGLASCRVNLSQKQVVFTWYTNGGPAFITGDSLLTGLTSLGFEAKPLMQALASDEHQAELKSLLWCMAVAGFAAANVMLLSVSIWSGAEGATRDLFHWLSALIALPTVAFAGRPFYRSAWQALKAGRLNMDVPISLAVILAASLSLFETINQGDHAFFDAAVTLLFFLLIGRTLDRMMRARAYQGVQQLLALKSETAEIVTENGQQKTLPLSEVAPDMTVLVRAGETIPIDGCVVTGVSDVNWSMVTGEAVPQTARAGSKLYSGLVNLSNPLTIKVEAVGENTLLAEIVRYMETAQSSAPRYRQLADRAASIYAPLVHLAALFTFIGWLAYGASWQSAAYIAISVLIITCPCALGLAVPVVQVVASAIAQRRGILLKEGTALEKLSEIDTVVFDKTGTLTQAEPELISNVFECSKDLSETQFMAALITLARHSVHPVSNALANHTGNNLDEMGPLEKIKEHPGSGLSCRWQEGDLKLGSATWVGAKEIKNKLKTNGADLTLWASFTAADGTVSTAQFVFRDKLRSGVKELIAFLQTKDLNLCLLSGDKAEAVKALANELGIANWHAAMKPQQKAEMIAEWGRKGCKVLMVGDGINDGPALKAAFVSLSPAKASDVAQVTASFVLMRDSLVPVRSLYQLAQKSRTVISQNFALAALYNLIAIPVAVMGGVTPIIAALAMSGSSLVVIANALRLELLMRKQKKSNKREPTAVTMGLYKKEALL